MIRLKLKAIAFDLDFRFSEATNHELFKKSKHYPGELATGEAFLFVSRTGKQLVWLLNTQEIFSHGRHGKIRKRTLTDSRRWRLSGGSWNPAMLANYATDVGIELLGLKRFEVQYGEERQRKRAERA